MAKAASLKTKVSTKGQVVLPKAIREKRGWGPGAELIVEERPEGVILRPAPKAAATRFEDVRGSTGSGRSGGVDRGNESSPARRGRRDATAERSMIAIDTNVIVRYLVADQPEQFRRATALIEAEQVFVPTTVALEAEWVLRAIYRLNRAAILGRFAEVRLPCRPWPLRTWALWPRRSTGPNKAWTSPTRSILPAPPAASPSRASIAGLSKRRRNWERLRSGRREARIGARAPI